MPRRGVYLDSPKPKSARNLPIMAGLDVAPPLDTVTVVRGSAARLFDPFY